MSLCLNTCRLPELQDYLRARGVTVSGYNKRTLREIAIAVKQLDLPVDPDFRRDSVYNDIQSKLKKAGLPNEDPLKMDGYTSDFAHIPDFGLIDVFNYLIFNKSDYDGRKLKGYKSFEDYRLFYDGHVESLLFNPLQETDKICLFKAKVKPTQRDKTYLNKDFYSLWFSLDKEDGDVITGHCECLGGSDGACRHLAAALYELEAFQAKSCTDGENQWKKRARKHDISLPVRHLTVTKARYVCEEEQHVPGKPHIDLFDPRPLDKRQTMQDQEKREFGLKLQEIAANAQALDILINPEDFPNKSHPDPKLQDLDQLSISYKAKKFMESHAGNMDVEDFYNSINYSKEDISNINEYTQGQATNEAWYEMRVGLLTASNFKQANKYIDDKKEPSKSFMRSLMGENRMEDHALPAPLKWGREKENVARDMYFRLRRRQHRCLRVKENGLLISEEFPVLGCSVDGICTCKCIPPHPPKIVEIKCPYSMRNEKPKDVAVKSKCIYDKSSGTWIVTPDSAYYAQIQGQLGLYGYENADLVIYTQKGIHVSHVHFDKNFFSSMAQKLVLFHKMYVLPVLLKQ